MIFSITGFAYLLISFGLGIFAYRCFEISRQKEGNQLAKLFAYFFLIFSLVSFVFGITSIFDNILHIAKIMSLLKDILFTLGCSVLGYLIIYFKFPRINPWLGFSPVFLMGVLLFLIDLLWGNPYITLRGEIVWGLPLIGYFLSFFLFLFTFFPMSFILFKQSKTSKDDFLKTKSFLFSLVALGGFIVALVELFLEPLFNLEKTMLNETILMVLNIILFTFLITSQKDFEQE